MNIIKKFIDYQYITEKVYLFKTLFEDYELIVDTYSNVGLFKLTLKNGEEYRFETQHYGDKDDKFIIIKSPNVIEYDLFNNIVKDITYILNKNQLGYKFKIEDIKEHKHINTHAILSFNKDMTINDLERIAQTTKIINPKVKKPYKDDNDDLDDIIFKTL